MNRIAATGLLLLVDIPVLGTALAAAVASGMWFMWVLLAAAILLALLGLTWSVRI